MTEATFSLEAIEKPSKWPSANARLLGIGAGLPVNPLDRLANFSADDFERFVLEWADGYLQSKLPGVDDVQQRGGAGDKRGIAVRVNWTQLTAAVPAQSVNAWSQPVCERRAAILRQ